MNDSWMAVVEFDWVNAWQNRGHFVHPTVLNVELIMHATSIHFLYHPIAMHLRVACALGVGIGVMAVVGKNVNHPFHSLLSDLIGIGLGSVGIVQANLLRTSPAVYRPVN